MQIRRFAALAATAGLVALGTLWGAAPVLAAVCDGSTASLANGGFETPVVGAGGQGMFPAAQVPPWQTTDSAGQIEIWGSGFQGVPAGAGINFAELNANSPGTLYQDVVTTPGQTMHWSLLHRARVGTDVMQVLIGDANTADPLSAAGWNFLSPDLSDDTTAWGAHAGDYVVPAGQTCTRFAFRAVSSGAGDPSFGNFLDAVGFSIPVPPTPTPRPTVHVTEPPTDRVRAEVMPADGGGPLATAFLIAAAFGGALLGLARMRAAPLRERRLRTPPGRSDR